MRNLTSYELHTGKLKKPVIFGVVSDLHDEPYDDLWPLLAGCDALLVPGDVVNRYTQTSARGIAFLQDAARRLPTFFSLGNHETKTRQFQALMQALNGTGAEILVNRYVPFGECWIGGWYDPEIVRQPDCMDEFERLPAAGCCCAISRSTISSFCAVGMWSWWWRGTPTADKFALVLKDCTRPGSISFRNTPRAS